MTVAMTKSFQFTDLETWKHAHGLALTIYEVYLTFPGYENYDLGSQLPRSSCSVTSNIAEGFGRQGKKENQLLVAHDVGCIDEEQFKQIIDQALHAHRLLNGLIRSTKGRDDNS